MICSYVNGSKSWEKSALSQIIFNATYRVDTLKEDLHLERKIELNRTGVCYTFLAFCGSSKSVLKDAYTLVMGELMFTNPEGYLNAEQMPLYYVGTD